METKKLVFFFLVSTLALRASASAQDTRTNFINTVVGTKIQKNYERSSAGKFDDALTGKHHASSTPYALYVADEAAVKKGLANSQLSTNDIRLAWSYAKQIEGGQEAQHKKILRAQDLKENVENRKAITHLLESTLENREKLYDYRAPTSALNMLVDPQQPSDISSNKQATQDNLRIAWSYSHQIEKDLEKKYKKLTDRYATHPAEADQNLLGTVQSQLDRRKVITTNLAAKLGAQEGAEIVQNVSSALNKFVEEVKV